MSDFQRIIELRPAWDKRDPNPKRNYGIHGVDVLMPLKGEHGATQFLLSTGWLLPSTLGLEDPEDWYLGGWGPRYSDALANHGAGHSLHPYPVDLGYHALAPTYDGQELMSEACPYLDDRPCYYDGSGLNAYRAFDVLLREGSDGVWRDLETYYASVFTPEAIA